MAGKKFQFSLASVLRLRRHESDQARQSLARAVQSRRQQEARLAELIRRLRDTHPQLPDQGPADPLAFRRLAAYRAHLERACDRERRTLEDLRRSEARARDTLIQKQRREESLQALHDEEKARHLQEEEKAETDFLDEQALLGFLKHKRSAAS